MDDLYLESRMTSIGQNGNTGAHYEWEDFDHRPKYYELPKTGRLEDLIKNMPHFRGAAFKYLLRAGVKDKNKELEDLRKGLECLAIEIKRLEEEEHEKHK